MKNTDLKILGLAIQKLGLQNTNKILLTSGKCITRRSIFIHPNAKNKQGELMISDGKIYNREGFIELFSLVEMLLDKL
jgi:hypothetical protein